MHFLHRADGAGLNPLADQPGAVTRVPLVSHLRDDLVLPGRLGEFARLIDRVGHGLLDIDVLACPHRRHGDDGMGVVGGSHNHGLDVFLLLQHLPEIAIHLRLRILLIDLGRVRLVHVAQGHNILPRAFLDIVLSHAPHADAGNIELAAGWRLAPRPDDVTWDNGKSSYGGSSVAKEISPGGFILGSI